MEPVRINIEGGNSMTLRTDAETIMQTAIRASLPDAAVAKALEHKGFGKGKIVLVAIGKAAWQMAKTAVGSWTDGSLLGS